MVAFNVVGRLRHQNDLNAYRRRLANEVEQDFAIRLLPALLDLPLNIAGADGAPRPLEQAIRAGRRVTLAGASGSGRRLALQQLALRWASGANTLDDGMFAPALLALPRIDDGASPPEHQLARLFRSGTPAPDPKAHREGLALFRRGAASGPESQPAPNVLLIYGWDELPPPRQAAWRAALLDLARDPVAYLAVTLPPDEPPWPEFTPLALGPAAPDLLRLWVERLAPPEHRAAMLDALARGAPLHPLAERLFDVALLSWVWPRGGAPRSRADLYARALAAVLGVPADRLAGAPAIAELQLLAAYDERPARATTALVVAGAGGQPQLAHPQVRRYLAARQLVAEERYDLLRQVEPAERADLALLAASILDDSAPVLAALWGDGRLAEDDVLALAGCLRETSTRTRSWVLRIVGALAQLARSGTPLARRRAQKLLADCMPALDGVLEAASASEPAHAFLLRLFDTLPDELATPRILGLALSASTSEPFAWTLADLLAQRPAVEQPPAPTEPPAQARWIYLQALRDVARRGPLEPDAAVAALRALGESAAGDARKLRAGAALLEDPAQAQATRLAALSVLADSDQPAALTVIERASDDAQPEVRGAALAALHDHDPERAAVALGRAAVDEAAPWELRLEAIQRLGDHLSRGAGRLLVRCAADTSLPLYARMQVVITLASSSAGKPYLLQLLNDAVIHAEVRASVARLLGAAGYVNELPIFLRLIENPQTDRDLVEGCCDALGALGSREASWALQRLIDRAHDDVALTLAAVRALGRIGDPDVAEPLSRLLGAEALYRLERGVDPHLIEQKVEECLNDASIPRPIARRLEIALDTSPTAESRPTTLVEFLNGEADSVRVAAARALAAIGGNSARAALLGALLDDATGGAAGDVIAALAEVEGPDSAEALGYLLDAQHQNPLTGWLVVRQLTDHPAGEAVMRRALARADFDAFTRGALAEGLGQRGALATLPTLRHLADDRSGDPHLRAQALLALGLLNDPSTETTLIRLIDDRHEDAALRGLAAEHLPEQLSNEGRRFVRDLLRNERPAAALAIGALKALGRARDREALPLMLRYAQDENPAVAQAAIGALTELGDASMAPMLVRISQQPGADHALRLQAVGALLRIGGEGYRPLLRIYLNQGALPFRLLALEYLIGAGTPDGDLLAMLADRSWPAPLRLRLLEAFAGDAAAAPTFLTILQDEDDDTQIRVLAAKALGSARHADAQAALVRLAASQQAPVALRLRCIEAAHAIGGVRALGALSRLAEDAAQPAAVRASALAALRETVHVAEEVAL